MSALAEIARNADEAVARARALLVLAVRRAAADGMTQVEIARETGRSQPEISRLLRFHGTGPRAMALRSRRAEVIRLINEAGGSNVRVFGSVATGEDHDGSDIDLLIDAPSTTDHFRLVQLELDMSDLLGQSVDVLPEDDLRPDIRQRVLGEAVAL